MRGARLLFTEDDGTSPQCKWTLAANKTRMGRKCEGCALKAPSFGMPTGEVPN